MNVPGITIAGSWSLRLSLVAALLICSAPGRSQVLPPLDPAGEPVEGELISLEMLLEHAATNAPRIIEARRGEADIAAAEALAAPARLADPELSIGLGPAVDGTAFGLGGVVSLMQELEVHGERALRSDIAARWSDQQSQVVAEALWAVHADVHGKYVDALAARQRWELLSDLVAFSLSVRDVVHRRVEAGEDSDLELALSDADLAGARQLQMAARADYVAVLADLAAAAGWRHDSLPVPVGELAAPRPAPDLERLLASARQNRPDLRVQSRRLERLEAELALARQQSRPDPAVGGEYEVGVLGGTSDHRLLLVVDIGLGTAARRRSAESAALADLGRAGFEADALVAFADAEIRAAWRVLDGAYGRLQLYESDLLPRWEGNLALVERAFAEGEIDLLGVLMAEERLLEQQMGAIETARDYYAALAALELAVGAEVLE